MEIGLIATVITAIATAILAFATFYYAYTNRKLMLSKEKEMNRPRKKTEFNLCHMIMAKSRRFLTFLPISKS